MKTVIMGISWNAGSGCIEDERPDLVGWGEGITSDVTELI